ncbi:MAG: hypothetical protein AAF226_06055 [Verrucomicrobiota bacterium]
MKWLSLIVLVTVFLVVGGWVKTSRAGYESAPYEVENTLGKVELRKYRSISVVSTPLKAMEETAASAGYFNISLAKTPPVRRSP